MRYLSQFLPKEYSPKLIATLFIIMIIAGNCARIGGQKNEDSPSTVSMEVSYYPTGQKEYSSEYLNGKLDGTSQHWSADGLLISKSEYSHGKLHGIWKQYYANGNIKYESHFFHGQKHGIEKWYFENGTVKSEQSFHFGVPSSTIIRWRPDGSIIY